MYVYIICMYIMSFVCMNMFSACIFAHLCIYANFMYVVHVCMCTCCSVFVLNLLNAPLLEDIEF